MKETQQVFIPADEVQDEDTEEERVITREPWEDTLHALADSSAKTIRIPRSRQLKKEQVVNSFLDAFQLMGGVSRLTLWGDENPTEFYKLYGKLLPRQSEIDARHDGGIKVVHVLPRGKLDE